jgi:glycosyltransferase involved in cell wall biosynthesis
MATTTRTDSKIKRIVYFVPEFPRLTETFIAREVEELSKSDGLEIRVLSLKKASGTVSPEVVAITVYRRLGLIVLFRSLPLLVKYPARVKEAFSLLSRDKSKSFFQRAYFLMKALGYSRIFSELSPDHIHVHFLSDTSTLAMLVSVILDLPFSVSAHAKDIFVEADMVSEKGSRADFIAVCNTKAYERCLELVDPIDRHKVFKLFHGVEYANGAGVSTSSEGDTTLRVLSVARLVEKKGLRYLIEASEILKQRGIEHSINIIGPGPLYRDLQEMIDNLGLQENVRIVGGGEGIPHSELRSYFESTDVFVLPSIDTGEGDSDGVPNVIVEAALAGIPVITTEAGSITDLIVHGETGLLVPQKDSQALATALEAIVLDPGSTDRLVSNARVKAGEMFDLKKNVAKLENLLLIGTHNE